MFYTIYKVTHKETGKVYIGKHQTTDPNDGYMGSGKRIVNAIKKYGVEAFEKEVLHVFETEVEMNAKEAELVTEEFCLREDTYNLCPGGKGGWGYVNKNVVTKEMRKKSAKITHSKRNISWSLSEEGRKKISENNKKRKGRKLPRGFFTGKSHSIETKEKISASLKGKQSGPNNSQFGTIWITNGHINKKVLKNIDILDGWYKGRTLKNTSRVGQNKVCTNYLNSVY